MLHQATILLTNLLAAAENAAEAGAAHAGGGGGLVTPDFGITIATAVTFLLLLGIIAKFGWGPFIKTLDDREAAIAEHVRRAEQARKEAEDLLLTYNRKLSEAKKESDDLITQARTRAEEVMARMTADARKAAEAITVKAMESIEAERLRAISELRKIVAEASASLAGKILKEELNAERHTRLIDEVMAGVSIKR